MKYVACKKFDSRVAIDGDQCVTTMQELYACIVAPDATELYIRQDFAMEYLTPTSLADLINNIKRINPRLSIVNEATAVDFMSEQVKMLYALKDRGEFIYALEKNPRDMFSLIQELCKFYMAAYSETLEANNKVSTQHLKIANLQRQLDDKTKAYEQLLTTHHETADRLHILVSRINYQHGHNLNMDTLLDAVGNRYDKILYIKEISRVHYTDTFIYYLQEILRTLYGVPCRLAVMEPFYAYDRAALYPDLKPSWDLTAEDVYSSDIFMAGYQTNLMEDILKNSSNIRYLVILDRAGSFKVHVHGENVETLWSVSDINDIGNFKYMDRVISYSTETLNIPHVPGFDAKTNEEKVGLYSSMPIMKTVINLLEAR